MDSTGWQCGQCGGQFIGQESPDHICPQCVVILVTTDYRKGA